MSAAMFAKMKELTARMDTAEKEIAQLKQAAQESVSPPRPGKQESTTLSLKKAS